MQENSPIGSHRKKKYGIGQLLNLGEFNPHLFLEIAKSKLIYIFAIVCVGFVLSYLYIRYSKPLYKSEMVVQFEDSNNASSLVGSELLNGGSSNFEYQIEILKSKFLLKKTLLQLGYETSYYNKGKVLNYELYKTSPINVKILSKGDKILSRKLFFSPINESFFTLKENNKEIGRFKYGQVILFSTEKIMISKTRYFENYNFKNPNQLFFIFNNIKRLTDALISNLAIKPLNKYAHTAKVIYRDVNQKKATDIVITLAKAFNNYTIEKRSLSSKQVLYFLNNQLEKQYESLESTENKIQNFQLKNNYFKLIQESGTSEQYKIIEKLENDIVDIEFQKSVINEIRNSINSDLENIDVFELLTVLVGTEYEGKLSNLLTKLESLLINKQNLLFSVTQQSGSIKVLDYQIKNQKTLLFKSIESLNQKLIKNKEQTKRKIEQLDKKKYEVSEKELKYRRIERVLSIDEKFLNLLMMKITEFSIYEAGFVANHTILEEATASNNPISPRKNLIYILGLSLSLALSFSFVYLLYLLKNSIIYESDINHIVSSNYAFLGMVPKSNKKMKFAELIVDKYPKSFITESFRIIRSNMQLMIEKNNTCKLITLTSTISGEGKTFCAVNLAGIIALTDKKSILIDLDLRKPKIHKAFDLQNNKGVSTILTSNNKQEECIQPTRMNNLDVITSGPTPPNPSELLLTEKFSSFINSLKEKYQYIIIDTPPIGIVSDALNVLKKSDHPIYVFKQDYSKKSFAQNIDYLIQDNQIKNLSAIINHVDVSKLSYGKTYGYTKEAGKGYYEEDANEKNSTV